MEAKDRAMDKIRDEMAKRADHPGIAAIGEYMTERLQADESLAENVLNEKKTLLGAFDSIRAFAQKNKTGNYCCVPPEKAFRLVCDYYGIQTQHAETQAPAGPDDALDLDALLGM